MVEDPSEYSCQVMVSNALGVKTELRTPHEEYLALGKVEAERLESYRALFKAGVGKELLKEIRENTNRGLALGISGVRVNILCYDSFSQ